jgi:hypothetical protein
MWILGHLSPPLQPPQMDMFVLKTQMRFNLTLVVIGLECGAVDNATGKPIDHCSFDHIFSSQLMIFSLYPQADQSTFKNE